MVTGKRVIENRNFSISEGAVLGEDRGVRHTEDGVGGEGRGNLRHRAATWGRGCRFLVVLVTNSQTVVGQLDPRRRAENNHIKDLGYNII